MSLETTLSLSKNIWPVKLHGGGFTDGLLRLSLDVWGGQIQWLLVNKAFHGAPNI